MHYIQPYSVFSREQQSIRKQPILKFRDEFYSVTVVYYTRNVKGDLVIDYKESETMKYFSLLK